MWTVKVLSLVAIRVMLLKQVFSEVAIEVAPDRVNVIGVVLRVVEFDKESGRLDAIIARVAGVDSARPSEVDIPGSLVDLCQPAISQFIRHVAGVFLHKAMSSVELCRIHFGSGQTGRPPLSAAFRLAAVRMSL